MPYGQRMKKKFVNDSIKKPGTGKEKPKKKLKRKSY